MPIGPFDRRKTRSRCVACSKRHLKCSSDLPCISCSKKGLVCEYATPKAKTVILVERGKQQTPASYRTLQIQKSPELEASSYYFYYFDVFLGRNRFTRHDFCKDVRALACGGSYLMDAILALGAMETIKKQASDAPPRSQSRQFALKSYSNSVSGLRHAINDQSVTPSSRNTVLWTTLLLGLFELVSDSTGQGWVQHIVHGTSSALLASGPVACQSGFGSRFFREIKVFEVCRAIVFNQPTFLARPEWIALSSSLQPSQEGDAHPLDALLDIIVMCSTLRVKAIKLIESLDVTSRDELMKYASQTSLEGFGIRNALREWQSVNAQLQSSDLSTEETNKPSSDDDFMLLARVFHSAASIYLSGVFDYEIVHWQDLGMMVSTLAEDEIQGHLRNILELSDVLLTTSKISPLLLLFPLRTAGARSGEPWQQQEIMRLLERIEGGFSVAAAFKIDLGRVWERLRLSKVQTQGQIEPAQLNVLVEL